MKPSDRALIAVDASALGPDAAFGAVLMLPDGTRLELSGPLPRTEYQEVTAAMAALRFLPPGLPATLVLDAQADVLEASLCITHPQVHVRRIPRNSTPEHERAHDLARAALRTHASTAHIPTGDGPQLAVYALTGVDSAPRFAVTYWQDGDLVTHSGDVARQPTKVQTLRAIQEAAQALTPPGMALVITGRATAKNLTLAWNVTREQLTAMRRHAEGALFSSAGE